MREEEKQRNPQMRPWPYETGLKVGLASPRKSWKKRLLSKCPDGFSKAFGRAKHHVSSYGWAELCTPRNAKAVRAILLGQNRAKRGPVPHKVA